MGYPGIRVDEAKLSWDPAEVSVPDAPSVSAGGDPLSALVAAVVPEYRADVAKQVAATRAREDRFAANLQAARGVYHGTDGAGKDQISAAGSRFADPADAFGAGSPVGAAAAASSSADSGGASVLSQLMGVAMQVGQQAVQAPMQALGAVGQLAQPVAQGVQGIVQQASQAQGKAGEAPKSDGSTGQVGGAGGGQQDGPAGKHEDKDKKDGEKSADDPLTDKAGTGTAAPGPQAPVNTPHEGSSMPGDAPKHRQTTETTPEVAL